LNLKQRVEGLEEEHQNLREQLLGFLRVFSVLSAESGPEHERHALRVEKMAADIATRLDMNPVQIHEIRVASLLHEIGQFGAASNLRWRPGWDMSGEEMKEHRLYPTTGSALVREIPGLESVVGLVGDHAENFDGSGLPNGKHGNDTPIGARIIRLADECDTILMGAHDPGIIGRVCEHVKAHSGSFFDPDLVPHALLFLHEDS
jgi:response regulator RpfG family c-di-GMP phosphodiesterase